MEVEIIKGRDKRNYRSEKLNVAAYIRVSTELEAQFTSFESQRKYYVSKIYRNSNWKFVGIYDDYGISARSVKNRTGFNNMIDDAVNGKIDLILTKSISRFARNTVDSIEYVRLLREHGVGVIFEEEGIYTLEMQSELLLTVLSSVAEQESNNNSSRTKKGIEMSFSNGRIREQVVSYGYTYKNGELKIVKKEADVIKKVFELYTSGTGAKDICKILNNEKIKPPYKKKWVPNYIYILLKCEKYIGILKFGNKYEYESIRIVSDDIFYKVKELMKSKKNTLKEGNDIFSGIVRCGFCGKVQGFCSGIGYYSTHSCRDIGCKDGTNIRADNVNRILFEFQNNLLENYEEIFKYKNENEIAKKRKLKKISNDYENQIGLLVSQRLNDKISKFEYNKKADEINKEYEKEKNKVILEDIKKDQANKVLNNLKNKLLSIDSFPAEEVSKELVEKLVKYMQFGETLKHNYKNKYNCRIVLKVDENYSSYKFKYQVDYSTICDNQYYIVLWKFFSYYKFMQNKKYIKVKIVIDKRDLDEVR